MENSNLLFYICTCFFMNLFETVAYNLNHQFVASKTDFVCNPLFCSRIICPDVADCPNGEIIPNASICGCCGKCIKYLNENDPCGEKHFPYADQPDKCKEGLECIDGFCTSTSLKTSCEDVVKRRIFLRDQEESTVFSKKLWIPDCDIAGRFKAKQCKEKKCLCVDEFGNTIFGQEEKELSENMTCGCSRALHKRQEEDNEHWMIRTQEHCTHTGDYNILQCIGDLCFCSNSTTGEVIGRVTKQPFMELLPCYNKDDIGHRYEKQCELQLMRTRSLRYQFFRKNIDIVGLEHVWCDVDGTFAAKQCQPDRCHCTDREGTGIKSYYVGKESNEREVQMKCNCARDEHDREQAHARYPRMTCDGTGNFVPSQCFSINDCYCVDQDGDAITEKLTIDLLKTVDCDYLLDQLQGRVKTTTTNEDDFTDDYDYR